MEPMMATVPPTATTPPITGPHVVTPSVAAERKLVAGPDPVTLLAPSLGSSLVVSLSASAEPSSMLQQ